MRALLGESDLVAFGIEDKEAAAAVGPDGYCGRDSKAFRAEVFAEGFGVEGGEGDADEAVVEVGLGWSDEFDVLSVVGVKADSRHGSGRGLLVPAEEGSVEGFGLRNVIGVKGDVGYAGDGRSGRGEVLGCGEAWKQENYGKEDELAHIGCSVMRAGETDHPSMGEANVDGMRRRRRDFYCFRAS